MMTPSKNKQKRSFQETPEPTGGKIAKVVKPRKAASSKSKVARIDAATHPKKIAGASAKPASAKKKTMRAELEDVPDGKFSTQMSPMLATLVDKPFDEPGWLYEIKWDGYRALGFMNKGEIELKSRNDKSFNEKFYPIYQALKDWGVNAIVDGEIVVVKDSGLSDFGSLQNWRSEADGDLLYYVFDVLWLDGKDLRNLPLTRRREILKSITPKEGSIRVSDAFAVSGKEFYAAAKKNGP